MAKNLLNKYVWLVETIYKAKQITYEEIAPRLISARRSFSQGSDVEVLEPQWFRDEMAEISKHMWNIYKDDKR